MRRTATLLKVLRRWPSCDWPSITSWRYRFSNWRSTLLLIKFLTGWLPSNCSRIVVRRASLVRRSATLLKVQRRWPSCNCSSIASWFSNWRSTLLLIKFLTGWLPSNWSRIVVRRASLVRRTMRWWPSCNWPRITSWRCRFSNGRPSLLIKFLMGWLHWMITLRRASLVGRSTTLLKVLRRRSSCNWPRITSWRCRISHWRPSLLIKFWTGWLSWRRQASLMWRSTTLLKVLRWWPSHDWPRFASWRCRFSNRRSTPLIKFLTGWLPGRMILRRAVLVGRSTTMFKALWRWPSCNRSGITSGRSRFSYRGST